MRNGKTKVFHFLGIFRITPSEGLSHLPIEIVGSITLSRWGGGKSAHDFIELTIVVRGNCFEASALHQSDQLPANQRRFRFQHAGFKSMSDIRINAAVADSDDSHRKRRRFLDDAQPLVSCRISLFEATQPACIHDRALDFGIAKSCSAVSALIGVVISRNCSLALPSTH